MKKKIIMSTKKYGMTTSLNVKATEKATAMRYITFMVS